MAIRKELLKTPDKLHQLTTLKFIKPVEKISIAEWAGKYRVLSSDVAAEAGKFKTNRAMYQNEPMNAFTDDRIQTVVLMCASQSGKSTIMENVIGRFAHIDPCAIMMIQPTVELAEDFSKSRIAPMIRDTKVLRKLFGDEESEKAKKTNNTILSKTFPGGRLVMCGANSPSGLASKPIRILLADEVDRFPDSAGNEGNPVGLAGKRMTTFWNRKMGLFSTPTVEGKRGGIEEKYLAGTREEWQHKCSNCGEFHLLKWKDMNTDYTFEEDEYHRKTFFVNSVKWRCPDCGFDFFQEEMTQSEQKYISQNPKALENGTRSFFVNCFASPWINWKTIALEWLEAQGKPQLEQVVVNTRFAESYKARGGFHSEEEFLKRREKYEAELPDGVLVLTAAVDTQDNRFEYEICGWGMGEECWGIERGVVVGRPDDKQTLDSLDIILDKEYSFKNGAKLKIARTFIDSGGHYTQSVYKYCIRRGKTLAIKGQGGVGIPLVHKMAKAGNYGYRLLMLGVDDGKQQVMDRLSIDLPGEKYFHFPENIDRGYDVMYFKGIISEQKKTVRKGGIVREAWVPVAVDGKIVRNEPLDLRVYNLACIKSLVPKDDEAFWIRQKENLQITVRDKTVTQIQPQTKPKIKAKTNKASTAFTGGIWRGGIW